MNIHLIRHAEAIERSDAVTDEHRYLTQRGRSRFRNVAVSFKKLVGELDLIMSSPLVRAVQTADILAEKLRYEGEFLVSSELAPGFSTRRLRDILASLPGAAEIALVGHEPDLGEVTRELLVTDSPCTLKKGSVAAFALDAGKASKSPEFLWLITGSGKVIDDRAKALERLQGE
jgi:phosphohistidine phosphatase